MKRHILRAPQTDRYGLDVPTKVSELEQDLPLIIGSASASLTSPGPTGAVNFTVASMVVSQIRGFTTPSGTNLTITIPETGFYFVGATFSWLSTTSTGGGVGRTVTYNTYQLQSTLVLPSVVGAIDGSYGRDNKLGPLVTAGDIPVYINSSAVLYLTAGTVITPLAVGVALAADLTARLEWQIARVS